MPKLQILTEPAYSRLREPTNLKAALSGYRTDSECSLVADSDRLDLPIYDLNGSASLSMPEEGLASKSDAKNAQLVYEYLGPLKAVYAAEGRLWASLTHGEFWKYSRWRFPLPANDESAVTHIRSHCLSRAAASLPYGETRLLGCGGQLS